MVYSKRMPARRRKLSGKKMTATAAPEGLTIEEKPAVEEPRPAVTQVVEVVEDDSSTAASPQSQEKTTIAEPASSEASVRESAESPVQEEESPTRKSMVEELYTTDRKPSVMPEISMHRNGSKKSLMVWAVVTIVVALLTGGILYGASRKGGAMKSFFARPTPTATPAPTSTPTPTPATVDKATFTVQVLNGGGMPGAASKMKTFLEGKGYKVSGTGNTPDYTFDTTEIHGKPTMTDAIANLKADLKDSYSLGTVAADLTASASADVNVIVGKE